MGRGRKLASGSHMRTHGTLIKWNDDRGFGFISPAQGNGEVFVHISAFPRDGVRPKLNELISYEIETGKDGKLRAVRIMRPGQRHSSRPARNHQSNTHHSSAIRAILGIFIVTAIGAFISSRVHKPMASTSSATVMAAEASSSFKCDGRTLCPQMTSCAEARYFLNNCPNTKMDGDHDGEPCEQQWCN